MLAELLAALLIDIDALVALLEIEERADVSFALLADERADEREEETELSAEDTPPVMDVKLPDRAEDAELIALVADAVSIPVLSPVGAPGTALLVELETI